MTYSQHSPNKNLIIIDTYSNINNQSHILNHYKQAETKNVNSNKYIQISNIHNQIYDYIDSLIDENESLTKEVNEKKKEIQYLKDEIEKSKCCQCEIYRKKIITSIRLIKKLEDIVQKDNI